MNEQEKELSFDESLAEILDGVEYDLKQPNKNTQNIAVALDMADIFLNTAGYVHRIRAS